MSARDQVDLSNMPADGKAGTVYLLSIQGTLKAPSYDQARPIHNATAGNPAGVAACRSLGDLSHHVYVRVNEASPLELLILDRWTSIQGLGQFFSDPQVQEGGNQIFESRDPVVWAPATDVFSYSLPAPSSKPERYLGMFRGTMKDSANAIPTWSAAIQENLNTARLYGQCAEQTFIRAPEPGGEASHEMLGLAVWHDLEGMNAYYNDTDANAFFKDLLAGPPATSIWKPAPGEWTEW